MMDYYSSFPMPEKLVRKQYLADYAIKHNIKVSDEVLETIVSTTPEYSLSGYSVFGAAQEIQMLMNHQKK